MFRLSYRNCNLNKPYFDELGDVADRRIVLSALVCKTEVKNNYMQHSLPAIFMLSTAVKTGRIKVKVVC